MTELSWRRTIFEQYASARRRAKIPGFSLDVALDITRHLPQEGEKEALLWLARFSTADAERRITEELDYLQGREWDAEWKLHDFDEPDDLKVRLERRGMSCHHVEALMLLEVAGANTHSRKSAEAEIRRATPYALVAPDAPRNDRP